MFRSVLLAAVVCVAPAFAGSIVWYNGDSDGFSGLLNEQGGEPGTAAVYDDFTVGAGGASITGVFSNDLLTTTGVTQAYWEIRSGVSVGDGGTLIASGTGTATETDLGVMSNGYEVYDIEVDGLNVNLDPGTYWLSVSPLISDEDISYVATTSGTNGVGSPQAQDGNSFFNSTAFGANFAAALDQYGGAGNGDPGDLSASAVDFSEGVLGSSASAPEPSTAPLLGGAMLLGGLVTFMRRRASRCQAN